MTEQIPFPANRPYICLRCIRRGFGGFPLRNPTKLREGWHVNRHCVKPHDGDDYGKFCQFWHVCWCYTIGEDCWVWHVGYMEGRQHAAEFTNLRPQGPLPQEWQPGGLV